MRRRLLVRSFLAAAVTCLTLASLAQSAERPPAQDLLPQNTLIFARIPSVPLLKEKFANTSGAKMYADPQLKPFMDFVYGSAVDAVATVEEQIGASLPTILSIPQGEACFAMILPDIGQPVLMAMLDAGEQFDAANKILDKAKEAFEKEMLKKTEQTICDVKVTIYDIKDQDVGKIALFTHEKLVVGFMGKNSKGVMENFISRLTGQPLPVDPAASDKIEDKPAGSDPMKIPFEKDLLSKNPRYSAIMSRCRGGRDRAPEVTWFVDPIGIFKGYSRGSFESTVALAFLPQLGLDGLSGVGGAIYFDIDAFDMLHRMHVLLENPRAGVLKALALKSGDLTPQQWVPIDATAYMSMHWDANQTFTEVAKLIDNFRTKGATQKSIEEGFDKETGVSFNLDILGNLQGRVTYVSWFDRPVRLNGQGQIVAFQVKDPEAAKKTLDTMVGKIPERDRANWEQKSLGGVTYYQVKVPPPRRYKEVKRPDGVRSFEPEDEDPEWIAPWTPCVGIVGDSLMLCNEQKLWVKIVTDRTDPAKSLARSIPYKLVASKAQRMAGLNKPGLMVYYQPDESMRFLYDLAVSEPAKQRLADPETQKNPFFKTLDDGLKQHPLPPYNVIAQYMKPAGAVVINEETGITYQSFALKHEVTPGEKKK